MSYQKYKEEVLRDPRSEKLNFFPDDKNHYVYRVSKDGSHYYGSRTDRDNKTIGDGYYTSSNYLEESFKLAPDTYKVKVVRKFNNSGDKILFESYIHQYFDVKGHDSFINRSNQTAFGFDTTGTKASEETKEKQRLYQQVLNSDLVRSTARSDKFRRLYAELNSNPERALECSLKIRNAHDAFNANPEKVLLRSKRMKESSLKAHVIFNANPEKVLLRSKRKSKPVKQYDLDGNFIQEFFGRTEAAKAVGLKNASSINHCCSGRIKTAGGYIWKN